MKLDPNMTRLDRAIAEVFPGWAVRRLDARYRLRAEGMQSFNTGNFNGSGAYAGTGTSRQRKRYAWWRSLPLDEDTLVGAFYRADLRQECRDLYRNDEITRAVVDRFASYAVWTGLYPQPQTSSKSWNTDAAAWWAEKYVPTADYRQINGVDLISHQRFAVRHRAVDGDLGFVLLDNGQIQGIEGERIATPNEKSADPNIIEGIKRTPDGLIIGYFVCDRDTSGNINREKFTWVPRENFVMCYSPWRIDQLRGNPDLAPAVNKLRDYNETDGYIINKIKIDAMQQFKRTTQSSDLMRARGATTQVNAAGKDKERVEVTEAGTVHNLQDKEDLEAFASATPNAYSVQYLEHELKTIACCMGVSYEIVMLIFTEGSFSSQRAAIMHNRHTFLEWHDWVISSMMQRIYAWRIAKAMKRGELPAAPVDKNGVSEWYKTTWSVPYLDWADIQKQVQAEERRYMMGTDSITSICNSMGRTRDDVFAEKASDIEAAMALANRINQTHKGMNITWRDIINPAIGNSQAPAPAADGNAPVGDMGNMDGTMSGGSAKGKP